MPSSSRTLGLLLAAVCLGIVGCVDNIQTVMRDRLANFTETVDFLMHVVDQPSAKEYNDMWKPRVDKKKSDIDERQRKVEDNMDKKDRKIVMDFTGYLEKQIEQRKVPEAADFEFPAKFGMYYAKERVAVEIALDREKKRLTHLLKELQAQGAQEKEWKDVKSLLDSQFPTVKK